MTKWIRKPWNCFSIIHGHGIHTNQNQEKMAEEKHHNERQNEFTQYTTKPSKWCPAVPWDTWINGLNCATLVLGIGYVSEIGLSGTQDLG